MSTKTFLQLLSAVINKYVDKYVDVERKICYTANMEVVVCQTYQQL